MKCFGFGILASIALISFAQAETALGPRIRQRFDDNWRFRRDAIASSRDANFKWTWKQADGADLSTPSLPGDIEAGQWSLTRIGRDVFRGRRGFAWYRTEIVRANAPNLTLHFEQVDDNAVIFLNGKRIFRHEGWSEPFDVPVSSMWNSKGPNSLAILVENTDGPGGIMGPVTLESVTPNASAREAVPSFNDRAWRVVHLPHDYVVEGTFTPTADVSHGSLPVTTAWYRKTFTLPKSYKGKSVWIDFDGIYRKSTVYLNGHKLGDWPSGYAGFRYDLNRYANFGGRNVIAVHVDPRQPEGWWYEGGGIYRHVWLNVANPLHVRPWGTYVRTDVNGPQSASSPRSTVHVEALIENEGSYSGGCRVTFDIRDPSGRSVGWMTPFIWMVPNSHQTVKSDIQIQKCKLWSIEKPTLYTLVTTVQTAKGNGFVRGTVVDSNATTFGIRTIRFDKDHGFFLNGKHVDLKGTCNHQDHAGVGIAIPDGLLEWRIKKLKKMGSNAYRCSHNPPTAELLDACDRLGMLVMDETRHLGDTQSPKTPSGTKAIDLSELKSLVLRDRNHPSVIMWSLFNEEGLQGTAEGGRIFTQMRDVVLSLDSTRPCTGAMNGGWGKGITLVEDLQGFNYGIGGYDGMHRQFPNLPMYASETASTVSTRGIYANDTKIGYVSAYDVNKPGWGATAEESMAAMGTRPWVAGQFVWTGFDYKGEPTPYGWPCINSHFGIMDICGFPKDNFFYYQAWWGDKPMVHILPHWNWGPGQTVNVWAYSQGDEVELFLNGRSLGRESMPRFGHVEWSVPFEAGSLVAKAYRNGQLFATDRVDTVGAPVAIRLKTTRSKLLSDEEDLTPVEVEIVDAKGRVVPTASNKVQFSVSGPARIVGVGNGDPSSHEPDKASSRSAFNGLCMALVGGSPKPGRIALKASSPGLRSATLLLTSRLLP